MNAYPEKQQYTADDLAAIIAILRDPECGCPWDKVQTHTSIRMNFLEEAYEAVDAIDLNDPALLCEELGDVMMQVVFHAQIEREAGHFTFDEVCDGVCRKLINRHPHIFGGDESIKDWDSLKNKEKGRLTLADELESVPKALPALMRAAKLQKRAARYGVQTEAADEIMLVDINLLQQEINEGYIMLSDGRYLPPKETVQQCYNAFGIRVGLGDNWEDIYDSWNKEMK